MMTNNVFPLTFQTHLIFCIIAVVFFIFQYIRTKSVYQLLTVFAVAGSLAVFASDSEVVFYGTGIYELIMLIAIGVTSAVARKKNAANEKNSDKAEEKNKDTQKSDNSEEIQQNTEAVENENSNS